MIFRKFIVEHADFIFSFSKNLICIGPYFNMALHATHLLLMTSDTIIFYNIYSCFTDENHLRLGTHRKYRGMSQSVFGFEIVFVENIIMRHMAVVATGFSPVGTVAPGGILRCHDVAVHAGFGIIRQVRPGPGGSEGKDSHTHANTQQDYYGDLPLRGRKKKFNDFP
jgi:hypothetical protein